MTDKKLKEEIERHVTLIHGLLNFCSDNAREPTEALMALINVMTSVAFAQKMSFDELVYEMSLRYSALEAANTPPGEDDTIH